VGSSGISPRRLPSASLSVNFSHVIKQFDIQHVIDPHPSQTSPEPAASDMREANAFKALASNLIRIPNLKADVSEMNGGVGHRKVIRADNRHQHSED
jgi:hypothetical protein